MSNSDHELVSFLMIFMFTLVLVATLAIVAIFYVKRWQRRTRFFAHARLNENVDEITNPIFDFTATEREEIAVPVTVSNNDDKVSNFRVDFNEGSNKNYYLSLQSFLNPLYESMYANKGLLAKKTDDDDEELKNDLL